MRYYSRICIHFMSFALGFLVAQLYNNMQASTCEEKEFVHSMRRGLNREDSEDTDIHKTHLIVPDSLDFVNLVKDFVSKKKLPIGGSFSTFHGRINSNVPKRNFKPPFVGKSISRRLQHEFMQYFVDRYRASHKGSRCLDWDGWYGGTIFADICDTIDVIEYSTPFGQHEAKRLKYTTKAGRVSDHLYYADIHNMTKCGVPMGVYDIVIANSVFEHLYNPTDAIQEIEKVMKPNGLLFWHTPFMFEQHGVPHDYFRYTISGARHIVESAGLQVVLSEADGGYAAVLSNLLGIGSQHWTSEELHDGEKKNDIFPYMSTRMIAIKANNS